MKRKYSSLPTGLLLLLLLSTLTACVSALSKKERAEVDVYKLIAEAQSLSKSPQTLDQAASLYQKAFNEYDRLDRLYGVENDIISQSSNTLNFLGQVYEQQGRLDKAEETYKKCLQRIEQLNIQSIVSICDHSLNALYRKTGRSEQVQLSNQKDAKFNQDRIYARAKQRLGLVGGLLYGDVIDKQREKTEQALSPSSHKATTESALLKNVADADSNQEKIEQLKKLAAYYYSPGDRSKYQQLEMQLETHDINKAVPHQLKRYYTQRETKTPPENFPKLIKTQKEIIELLTDESGGTVYYNSLYYNACSTLARILEQAGQLDEAEKTYRQAKQDHKKSFLKQHTNLFGMSLVQPGQFGSETNLKLTVNLADFYARQQRYAEAKKLYHEVLSEHQQNKKWNQRIGLYQHLNRLNASETHFESGIKEKMAKMELQQGNPEQMVSVLQERLGNINQGKATALDSTEQTQHELIRIFLEANQPLRALKVYQSILRSNQDQLINSLSVLDQHGQKVLLSGGFLNSYQQLNQELLDFYRQYSSPQVNLEALNFSLLRKGMLAQINLQKQSALQRSRDPLLIQKQAQLKQLRKRLSNQRVLGQSQHDNSALTKQISELERSIFRQIGMNKPANITAEQVIRRIGPNAALIDFHVYQPLEKKEKEQLIAIVVHHQTVELINFGDFAPIADTVLAYRQKINQQTDVALENDRLYQTLWQPLNAYVQGAQSIYLAKDNILHFMPFAALKDEANHFLLERYQLHTLNSVRDLAANDAGRRAATSEAMVIANPDYNGTALQLADAETAAVKNTRSIGHSMQDLYFAPLPFTEVEGQNIFQQIQQHFPAKLYTGASANEENLKTASNPKILHIATHGYFLSNNSNQSLSRLLRNYQHNPALDSGLVLAHANKGLSGHIDSFGNDGILTALEASQLNLNSTELVTLSACETGIGELMDGEGFTGLSRAFHMAGAKSVLSSLWQISDRGTMAFMKRFYQRFLSGQTPQQALRQTQLEFISSQAVNSPYYWAAFVITGKE